MVLPHATPIDAGLHELGRKPGNRFTRAGASERLPKVRVLSSLLVPYSAGMHGGKGIPRVSTPCFFDINHEKYVPEGN
jgi:hypothetical protein